MGWEMAEDLYFYKDKLHCKKEIQYSFTSTISGSKLIHEVQKLGW